MRPGGHTASSPQTRGFGVGQAWTLSGGGFAAGTGRTVRSEPIIVYPIRRCLSRFGSTILQPLQEGRITEEHIHGELGQVIAGQVAGRTFTLFKSVGLALQDVATAARVYALAVERGVGKPLPL